jgi:hypothetical protein
VYLQTVRDSQIAEIAQILGENAGLIGQQSVDKPNLQAGKTSNKPKK